ncbi:sensor histidine kinase [Pseudozobellia thermophila]|uniref:Histidine kinase n=1 Tax=Pseudozobellia thermophila TaxID=192903 RepID=A0A1M6KC14_9FLAO|nr:histidine kinase [Pseudozobellia thermophila]SHJ56450.1 Histidine kinase [Pseudozobellia thermophila]
MGLEKPQIRQIAAHFVVWAFFAIFLMYPTIAQGRRLPTDIPSRLGLAILIFYINYFFLVPQFLLKKRTRIYVVLSLVLLVGISYVSDFFFKPQFIENLRPNLPKRPGFGSFRQSLMFIMIFGIPFAVSTIIKVYAEWKKNEDLRIVTEKEKINSELQFLKAQLNPHFLFNSLNTIYSLSVKNSPDTPEAVMNISELMRYMLYEANREKVPLNKEISYLKNYVQLQRLRLSTEAKVKLKIKGDPEGKAIAPLLFITFIENAFKYGTDFQGNTEIEINLDISEASIDLYVLNLIGAHQGKEGSSGVGIENVKNRLNLLYPDSHELNITNDGEYYEVRLHLNLN